MLNSPPSNLIQGIYLAQSGSRAEALRYLRHAARTEVITAEGWLWLAAVTDDLEEYRHCVNQALREDPNHPTALRMREALEVIPAPITGTGYAPVSSARSARVRPSRGWRLLRVVAVLLILGVIGGGVAALILSGVVLTSENGTAVSITLSGDPAYQFDVELPDSWIPADEDSAAWRTRRDELREAFPDSDLWDQIDESFSAVKRDPVYGVMSPSIHVIETDPAALKRDGMAAALTLQEIVPLPDVPDNPDASVCDRMRLLEQQFQDGGKLESVENNQVVESAVALREDSDDCVFYVQRRYTRQEPHQVVFPLTADQAPDSTRSLFIAVPVEGERYAAWILTIADKAYSRYETSINTIIGSLVYSASE
jgi:hypothetical protein